MLNPVETFTFSRRSSSALAASRTFPSSVFVPLDIAPPSLLSVLANGNRASTDIRPSNNVFSTPN